LASPPNLAVSVDTASIRLLARAERTGLQARPISSMGGQPVCLRVRLDARCVQRVPFVTNRTNPLWWTRQGGSIA